MNDFKECYQRAMRHMPGCLIDADSVLNEARHKKALARRRKQALTSSLLFLCLVCLCGVGSVKAAEYFGSVIRVSGSGFITGDKITMQENAAAAASLESAASTESGAAPLPANPPPPANSRIFETQDFAGTEAYTMETKAYTSLKDFLEAEPDAVLALPDMPKDQIQTTEISMVGDAILFYQQTKDGKTLSLYISNYADTQRHTTSIVYADGITNERTYTTKDGYTYTLIDSPAPAADPRATAIHAATAAGTYEIIADFWGYTETETLAILETIDHSLYLD